MTVTDSSPLPVTHTTVPYPPSPTGNKNLTSSISSGFKPNPNNQPPPVKTCNQKPISVPHSWNPKMKISSKKPWRLIPNFIGFTSLAI